MYEFKGRAAATLLTILRFSQTLHRIAITLASIIHKYSVKYSVINSAAEYIYLDGNTLDEGDHDKVFVIAEKNMTCQWCVPCNLTFGNAVNRRQRCCGVVFELFDPENRLRIAFCQQILHI